MLQVFFSSTATTTFPSVTDMLGLGLGLRLVCEEEDLFISTWVGAAVGVFSSPTSTSTTQASLLSLRTSPDGGFKSAAAGEEGENVEWVGVGELATDPGSCSCNTDPGPYPDGT